MYWHVIRDQQATDGWGKSALKVVNTYLEDVITGNKVLASAAIYLLNRY